MIHGSERARQDEFARRIRGERRPTGARLGQAYGAGGVTTLARLLRAETWTLLCAWSW